MEFVHAEALALALLSGGDANLGPPRLPLGELVSSRARNDSVPMDGALSMALGPHITDPVCHSSCLCSACLGRWRPARRIEDVGADGRPGRCIGTDND